MILGYFDLRPRTRIVSYLVSFNFSETTVETCHGCDKVNDVSM